MPKRRTKVSADRDPPEIAQIRRIRARMWKEAGGTLDGYFGYIRGIQAGLSAAGIIISTAPTKKKQGKRASGSRKRAA